jgi:hypothetical protein
MATLTSNGTSNGTALTRLPFGLTAMVAAVAGELKKAVESCVQHDLEPTNQARRCASLDRGLHETAGMLGA